MLLLDRIKSNVERDVTEGDVALYQTLLLYGEYVFKLVVLSLVASIDTEREGYHYRQLHSLVRANSLGEWVRIADDVLGGPTAAHLTVAARPIIREWTQPVDDRSWQHIAVRLLVDALLIIEPGAEQVQSLVQGRRWLSTFAQYRNASIRGHGVESAEQISKIVSKLRRSIDTVVQNSGIFDLQCAHLRRNLSGKYRLTPVSGNISSFAHLRSTSRAYYPDGLYLAFDENTLRRIELIEADIDSSDFYVPNGAFTPQKYQVVSYISGLKRELPAEPYLRPAGELPRSETEGSPNLDVLGKVFSNLPSRSGEYVRRLRYEDALRKVLIEEIHPIATLVGRGGIGKTSMALEVLTRIAQEERFFAILWFSARDIDLLDSGPKVVRPGTITEIDVAREFVRYLGLEAGNTKKTRSVQLLAEYLEQSPAGPLLFVFDNFETFINPAEFYTFIDTYLRPPNKVLITSRERRHFKGDYPIEVGGMETDEGNSLIDLTAHRYHVLDRVTDRFKSDVIDESGGHPYIIKVLVGELARQGRAGKVERILAAEDAMLSALFERTYATLTPAAKRIFLLLSSWRSKVYRLSLEAVLLRPVNERIDLAGVEELIVSSFIEQSRFGEDGFETLTVPLVAQIFGRQKLRLSTERFNVERDSKYLQAFGAMQGIGTRDDFDARLRRVAAVAATSDDDAYVQIMEYCASRVPSAWLLLSELFEERGDEVHAFNALERLLERPIDAELQIAGWRRRIGLATRRHDMVDEIMSWSQLASISETPFFDVSSAANRVNTLYGNNENPLTVVDKSHILDGLATVMQARILEGDAIDRSRLAWLYVHLGERHSAIEVAKEGLRIGDKGGYCKRLLDRLGAK